MCMKCFEAALKSLIEDEPAETETPKNIDIVLQIKGPAPETMQGLFDIMDESYRLARADVGIAYAKRMGFDTPTEEAPAAAPVPDGETDAGFPELAEAAKAFRCPDGFETLKFSLRGHGVAVHNDQLDAALKLIAGGMTIRA